MPFLDQRRLYGKVAEFVGGGSSPASRGRPPHFGDILRVLREYNLLPAIFFLKSRSECDGALKTCRAARAFMQARLSGRTCRTFCPLPLPGAASAAS